MCKWLNMEQMNNTKKNKTNKQNIKTSKHKTKNS